MTEQAAAPTKQRILDVTEELFKRHGYTGTGLKQVVELANAPFGSLYHHFPGGKEALGEAVVRRAGQMYYELFVAILDAAGDPIDGVRDFFDGGALVLEQTDWVDPCPIGTVALEKSSSSEPLRVACAEVFTSWIDGAAEHLVAAGLAAPKARELAITIIAGLQGAFHAQPGDAQHGADGCCRLPGRWVAASRAAGGDPLAAPPRASAGPSRRCGARAGAAPIARCLRRGRRTSGAVGARRARLRG